MSPIQLENGKWVILWVTYSCSTSNSNNYAVLSTTFSRDIGQLEQYDLHFERVQECAITKKECHQTSSGVDIDKEGSNIPIATIWLKLCPLCMHTSLIDGASVMLLQLQSWFFFFDTNVRMGIRRYKSGHQITSWICMGIEPHNWLYKPNQHFEWSQIRWVPGAAMRAPGLAATQKYKPLHMDL